MTGRAQRVGLELAAAVAAGAFAWSAVCSWRGMVAVPSDFLVPALVAAVLVAVVGTVGRSLRLRWYGVLPLQLVVLVVWFGQRENPGGLLGGWIPTPDGLSRVVDRVVDGSSAINTYAAPVPATFVDAPVYLIACAVGVLLLVDLLACGFRLPAWAGLPVLVAVTVPISVLDDGLPSTVYVATGILFAVLLAVVEAGRTAAWGPVAADPASPRSGRGGMPALAVGAPAVLIGTAATLLALLVSLGVPVGDGLFRPGSGTGAGAQGSGQITLSNPLVDLRRDLVRNNQVPLLSTQTDARDLGYLRLTVLDEFVDGAWAPSPRDLAEDQRAEGELPLPAGFSSSASRRESRWELSTSRNFETSWLPTPSLTSSISIDEGDWRYDPAFLDIASADDPVPTSVDYRLTANALDVTADELAAAPPAPFGVAEEMTRIPALPQVVTDIAREVTASGTTAHAKAVLLQSWFRTEGGFTYSLDPAPGDGLDQLARFVTTDKVGYCEQYAAAMALMARSLGIPARVVVGFLGPTETDQDRALYTSDDLHAWPEIYFSGAGWVRFEPTPSTRTGTSPSWTRGTGERPAPSATPTLPSATPTPQAPATPVTPEPTAETARTDQGGTPLVVLLYGVGTALVVLVLALPALLRTGQRRRRYGADPDPRSEVENLWAELRATAIDLGVPWPGSRSPRMVAETLRHWLSSSRNAPAPADEQALAELVSLVERARYREGFEIGASERDAAAATTRRWSQLLAETVPPARQWLARLAPRSVLTRGRDGAPARTEEAEELAGTDAR